MITLEISDGCFLTGNLLYLNLGEFDYIKLYRTITLNDKFKTGDMLICFFFISIFVLNLTNIIGRLITYVISMKVFSPKKWCESVTFV